MRHYIRNRFVNCVFPSINAMQLLNVITLINLQNVSNSTAKWQTTWTPILSICWNLDSLPNYWLFHECLIKFYQFFFKINFTWTWVVFKSEKNQFVFSLENCTQYNLLLRLLVLSIWINLKFMAFDKIDFNQQRYETIQQAWSSFNFYGMSKNRAS